LPLVSTAATARRHRTQNSAQHGMSAEFSRPPISEFFNTIGRKLTLARRRNGDNADSADRPA
jgi:hypothetical protein